VPIARGWRGGREGLGPAGHELAAGGATAGLRGAVGDRDVEQVWPFRAPRLQGVTRGEQK